MSLLIAITAKPDLHPDLRVRSMDLLGGCVRNRQNINAFGNIDTAIFDEAIEMVQPKNTGQYWKLAEARNALLDMYLKPRHEWVFWIDADMVGYSPDLPAKLLKANPDGVTAPMVFIDKTDLFYDTLGFIETGHRLLRNKPYFRILNGSNLVELDSVGCIYLIPASVLRKSRYASLPYDESQGHWSISRTGHTDHWPVMQAAAQQGVKIACLKTEIAYHANLPEFGEIWH